jgi:hypothetical protein
MKRDLRDKDVREAVGRILRDQPLPGDGSMLLEALEAVREHVDPRPPDACALQQESGRRRLAHDLIEIGREEFERVHSAESGTVVGRRRFGGDPGFTVSGTLTAAGSRRSRRRGPAGPFVDASRET